MDERWLVEGTRHAVVSSVRFIRGRDVCCFDERGLREATHIIVDGERGNVK
jgi:hypothetical protein